MDIFNKETINDLLILSEHGENADLSINIEPTFTRKLLVGKVLIDRWENVTTDIFVHTSVVDDVFKELSKKDFYEDRETMLEKGIWGASIYAINEIPKDKCLMVALDKDGNLVGDVPSRAVASFTI